MHDDHYAPQTAAVSISNLLAAQSCIAEDMLPSIPTLNTTRLQLELLLQESSIDLSAVSKVILEDFGATLQILRVIGEEYPAEVDRPTRMEDCLVSLNMDRWVDAICASTTAPCGHVLAQWQYFRRVAQCARELAKCVEGLAPEEAYLIGLLCDVGKLPHLLGWNHSGDSTIEQETSGWMLADYWHLPAYLLRAIHEQKQQPHPSCWSEILQIARQVANQAEIVSSI